MNLSTSRLLLLAFLIGLSSTGPAGAEGASESDGTAESGAATEETSAMIDVKAADLDAYVAAYPKMNAFMGKQGAAMEAAGGDPLKGVAAVAGMQTDFDKKVGLSFSRFFELHSAITGAFAEAMAERSRQQQKKSISDSLAELEKQLANKDLKGEPRAEVERSVAEMKTGLKELEQPMPPDPNLSAVTRKTVQTRLDDLERIFSQQVYTGEK